MSFDLKTKIVIGLWGSITGITVFVGAYFGDYIPYQVFWKTYLGFTNSDNFLTSVLAFFVSIYALALPLSVNTISTKLVPYGDSELIKWFNSKWEVYYLRLFLPLLIAYIIILLFLNISIGFGVLVVFVATLYTIYMIYRYFSTIFKIVVDTESEIINWSSKIAKDKLK